MRNPWLSDYDATEDFHAILDALHSVGFYVSTYGNDSAPSVALDIAGRGETRVQIWIDYRDATQRENGVDVTQYAIHVSDHLQGAEFYIATDSRREVIETARALAILLKP